MGRFGLIANGIITYKQQLLYSTIICSTTTIPLASNRRIIAVLILHKTTSQHRLASKWQLNTQVSYQQSAVYTNNYGKQQTAHTTTAWWFC
jgi:hypothetical protein